MQNNPVPSGSIIEPAPAQPFAPSAPGNSPMNTGTKLTSGAADPAQKKARSTVAETVLLILMSIIAIAFIWLYVQKYIEWDALNKNYDSHVSAAIATAVAENTTELEAKFAEREKYDYKRFTGPVDYGSFSFEYPKTWSVYIAKDAANGGDFEAYLNPVEVNPISNTTVNALRVRIRDTPFDSVIRNYEGSIKNGKLTLRTDTVGGVLANIYTGELSPNFRGAVMVMKLRDKTVVLQTDAEIFMDDFARVLETVTLVE